MRKQPAGPLVALGVLLAAALGFEWLLWAHPAVEHALGLLGLAAAVGAYAWVRRTRERRLRARAERAEREFWRRAVDDGHVLDVRHGPKGEPRDPAV